MNIYCFSTLSFAKLQFKSVINKAFHKHGVASFTDAWIETIEDRKNKEKNKSHLLQMRGLKLKRVIEYGNGETSHLLQMRGLKLYIPIFSFNWNTSHLLQMRGLKQRHLHGKGRRIIVASFTDAWIETCKVVEEDDIPTSHLLQMRGLKQMDLI